MFVFVIVWVAGGEFAVPIDGEAHGLKLAAHGFDVFFCPFAGVEAAFDGGVFCRQSKSVPAHRVQDVKAFGGLKTGDDIAECVVADMAHMDAAGWIGEHLEDVIFFLCGVFSRFEAAGFFPGFAPFGFALLDIVAFRHDVRISQICGLSQGHLGDFCSKYSIFQRLLRVCRQGG